MTAKQVAHDGHLSETPSLAALIERHLELLRSRNYSGETLKVRRVCLLIFARWCAAEGIAEVTSIREEDLERYSRHLQAYRTLKDAPLSAKTRVGYLIALRVFFLFLVRGGWILTNPARRLALPDSRTLPKALDRLTAERVIAQPDLDSPAGLRDRAMLEVLYSTGIRRSELARLGCADVDTRTGTVFVRGGKGGKDRVIPIGERAGVWVERYLSESRPVLLRGSDPGVLFVSQTGAGFHASPLGDRLSQYFHAAGISRGSCHLLRHTAATLMMENGADLRYVQEFLGHTNPQTTQIYTKVNVSHLKQVHAKTHPAARRSAHVVRRADHSFANRASVVHVPLISHRQARPALTHVPGSLPDLLATHLLWMQSAEYRPAAIHNRNRYVQEFLSFCDANGVDRALDITTGFLEGYQKDVAARNKFLSKKRDRTGHVLSIHTQYAMLASVCMFCRWLHEKGHVLYDPSAAFVLPRRPKTLPRAILTVEEAERILAQPDTSTPYGLRDRAMLEVLYATGLRRGELAGLCVGDFSAHRFTLLIRSGKTGRERMVPVGRRCSHWLDRYLDEVRPVLVEHREGAAHTAEASPPSSAPLFCASHGGRFNVDISELVRKYMRAADVNKPAAVHIFRHTAATLMMENGADLRSVQEMLGHERISSTEVYTRVSIRRLKEVHERTHPAEILVRERRERTAASERAQTPEKQGKSRRATAAKHPAVGESRRPA